MSGSTPEGVILLLQNVRTSRCQVLFPGISLILTNCVPSLLVTANCSSLDLAQVSDQGALHDFLCESVLINTVAAGPGYA